MKLTKPQIERTIALEQAWSNYLESTKTREQDVSYIMGKMGAAN